jgi:hypothetical protein
VALECAYVSANGKRISPHVLGGAIRFKQAGRNQSRFWLTSMRCTQPAAYDRRPVDSDNGFGCFGVTLGRLIRVFRSNKGREATTEQTGVCSDEQTCWLTSERQFKDQIQ